MWLKFRCSFCIFSFLQKGLFFQLGTSGFRRRIRAGQVLLYSMKWSKGIFIETWSDFEHLQKSSVHVLVPRLNWCRILSINRSTEFRVCHLCTYLIYGWWTKSCTSYKTIFYQNKRFSAPNLDLKSNVDHFASIFRSFGRNLGVVFAFFHFLQKAPFFPVGTSGSRLRIRAGQVLLCVVRWSKVIFIEIWSYFEHWQKSSLHDSGPRMKWCRILSINRNVIGKW